MGFALAGGGVGPRPPLAVLFPAAFAPDLTRLMLRFGGVSPPMDDVIGGSVMTTLLLAGAASLAWTAWSRDPGGGAVVGGVVVSHAAGDFVQQSVPLWPGGPDAGLMLAGAPILDHGVQLVFIGAGWWLYRRGVRSSRSWEVWAVLALVLGAHGASLLYRTVF